MSLANLKLPQGFLARRMRIRGTRRLTGKFRSVDFQIWARHRMTAQYTWLLGLSTRRCCCSQRTGQSQFAVHGKFGRNSEHFRTPHCNRHCARFASLFWLLQVDSWILNEPERHNRQHHREISARHTSCWWQHSSIGHCRHSPNSASVCARTCCVRGLGTPQM